MAAGAVVAAAVVVSEDVVAVAAPVVMPASVVAAVVVAVAGGRGLVNGVGWWLEGAATDGAVVVVRWRVAMTVVCVCVRACAAGVAAVEDAMLVC